MTLENHACKGLIPAHAGKTEWDVLGLEWNAAHPRSRGENIFVLVPFVSQDGSSPLTRGKPSERGCNPACAGLIPAHAGKTASCTGPHGK